jgi:hypothetical protein
MGFLQRLNCLPDAIPYPTIVEGSTFDDRIESGAIERATLRLATYFGQMGRYPHANSDAMFWGAKALSTLLWAASVEIQHIGSWMGRFDEIRPATVDSGYLDPADVFVISGFSMALSSNEKARQRWASINARSYGEIYGDSYQFSLPETCF